MATPRILRAAGLVAVLALAAGCNSDLRRLDEHVFYTGPGYQLKVVRYYENLPLHYSGEIYSVQCRSPVTRKLEALPAQDPGWRILDRGGAIGTQRASDIVSRLERRYLPIDATRLVWLDRLFRVTFDGCGTFASWDPTALPPERIDPVEKPDYCAPKGTVDCRSMDFEGDRSPSYEDIHVEPDGRIRFVARTPAFRGVVALRVASDDFGRTWRVDSIEAVPSGAATPARDADPPTASVPSARDPKPSSQ